MVAFLSHRLRSMSDASLWIDPSHQPDIRSRTVKIKQAIEGSIINCSMLKVAMLSMKLSTEGPKISKDKIQEKKMEPNVAEMDGTLNH